MKFLMNFAVSEDDTARYRDAEDLRGFYLSHGLDGLELMPLDGAGDPLVASDMVMGVHLCCLDNWIDVWRDGDRQALISHYRKNLNIARELDAAYVVFHVSQMNWQETLGEPFCHTDAEVAEAACGLINAMLDEQNDTFLFLMENMWYPGLTFLDSGIPQLLIRGIHYKRTGFMLDTGHLMHTNLELKTQEEAAAYVLEILHRNEEILPYIYGVHLHQSLTGAYVKDYMKHRPPIETDPEKLFTQVFSHVFKIDLHQPFTDPRVGEILSLIRPEYVTLEYITENRQIHDQYLRMGMNAIRKSSDAFSGGLFCPNVAR